MTNIPSETNHASLLRRYCADGVDILICIFFFGLFEERIYNPYWVQTLAFVLLFFYYFMEGSFLHGASLGKRLLRIKIVSLKARELAPWQIAVRGGLIALTLAPPILVESSNAYFQYAFVSGVFLLYLMVFVYPIRHPENRSALDVLTKTWLVKEKSQPHGGYSPKDWSRASSVEMGMVLLLISILIVFGSSTLKKNAELQKASTELSLKNKRMTRLQVVTSQVEGVSEPILLASIHLHSDEIENEEVQRKYINDNISKLEELQKSLGLSNLETEFYYQVRVGYIFPFQHTIKVNLFNKLEVKIDRLEEECKNKANAYSCTDAAYYRSKEGDLEGALKFSMRACDLKDPLGCYNVACYHCRKDEASEALKFFEIALQNDLSKVLGEKKATTDPDLSCIQKQPKFLELLKKYPLPGI